MSWEAIGALGEVLGGLAVLVTFVFLSFQIRSNTLATRAQISHSGIDATNRWRSSIYQDAELHEIWRRGSIGEELNKQEKARFETVMTSLWFIAVDTHRQAEMGYLLTADRDALIYGMLARGSGAREFFIRAATRSNSDFSKLVLKRADEIGGE